MGFDLSIYRKINSLNKVNDIKQDNIPNNDEKIQNTNEPNEENMVIIIKKEYRKKNLIYYILKNNCL